MATADDFRENLLHALDEAAHSGFSYVELTAGALHRRVGGYPGPSHRMPVCCNVMRSLMGPSDRIIEQPPKGDGATLLIQYALPRAIGSGGSAAD